MIYSDLFTDVRESLNDSEGNLYGDALMVRHVNRAVSECWHLLLQVGAEVAMTADTITTDGAEQDYALPTTFQAMVPRGLVPRSTRTLTADYTHAASLPQIGLHDARMTSAPTVTASPTSFALYASGTTQYVRFNTLPPSGEYFDYQYYSTPQTVTVGTIGTTNTPWLGLLDTLLARILEQFCREGLEFITLKRDIWRAKTENDIITLLGLRHLHEIDATPSMWKGFPV